MPSPELEPRPDYNLHAQGAEASDTASSLELTPPANGPIMVSPRTGPDANQPLYDRGLGPDPQALPPSLPIPTALPMVPRVLSADPPPPPEGQADDIHETMGRAPRERIEVNEKTEVAEELLRGAEATEGSLQPPAAEGRDMKAGDPITVAREVAQRYGVEEVFVEDGFVNCVIVGDERVVIKAPQIDRPEGVQANILKALANEARVLTRLETQGTDFAPITVPRLVEYSADPAYLVATYVPGRASVPPEEVQTLSQLERERLGADYGSFIASLSSALDDQARAELHKERVFAQAVEKYIGRFNGEHYPELTEHYPELTKMAATLYERWQTYQASLRETKAPQTLIHGDLKLGNVTVSNGYRLQGVFDFALAGVGEVAEELSPIINIDPIVFKSCMNELKNAGIEVNPEAAWLWREVKDFHVLPGWIITGNPRHENFVRLRSKIVQRYPHIDWSELYRT